jgi:glutathione S-transferase
MKLFGTFVSPFVRRVAVSLNVLGVPYESVPLAASKQPEEVRKYNPLTRVPALMLDSGETLIESSAILDAIDQMVEPERALVPRSGEARRRVLKIVSVGTGCADKSVWAYYEVTKRPKEKVHQPWLAYNEGQVLAGYTYLEDQLKQFGVEALFRNGATLNQAGITCAVAFRFTAHVRPNLDIAGAAPTLASFSQECEATDAFRCVAIG